MTKERREKGFRLRGEGTLVQRTVESLRVHSLWLLRRRLRSLAGCGGRGRGRQRYRRLSIGVRSSGSGLDRRIRKRLIEHGPGRPATRRSEREQETQKEKESTAPPARLREQVACLASSEQRARRAADTAECRGETLSLSALKQNSDDENDTVDGEQHHQKGVQHLCGARSEVGGLSVKYHAT